MIYLDANLLVGFGALLTGMSALIWAIRRRV